MEKPSSVNATPLKSRHGPRVLAHPLFWSGLFIFLGLILLCFWGPVLYPASPYAIHLSWIGRGPSATLPLGGDELGRNELARIMLGGQLLIVVGLASALVATAFGATVGLAAGLIGGRVDRVLTSVTDVVLSVPQLVPLLLIDVLLRPSATTMIFVVALTSWPVVARLVRAESLRIRELDYVTAAQSLGAGDLRIAFFHVLANQWASIWVSATTQVGAAVLTLATASFLGFGLPPPFPNWAGMIAASTSNMSAGYWWTMVFPGLAFVLLQLSVNFISDAVGETYTVRKEVA